MAISVGTRQGICAVLAIVAIVLAGSRLVKSADEREIEREIERKLNAELRKK